MFTLMGLIDTGLCDKHEDVHTCSDPSIQFRDASFFFPIDFSLALLEFRDQIRARAEAWWWGR
jgi:hypothetical protein